MACATYVSIAPRLGHGCACVGAPPEKEVFPEPRENGALLAAIGRVLRGALGVSPRQARKGPLLEAEQR
jgi:hypothetical protein